MNASYQNQTTTHQPPRSESFTATHWTQVLLAGKDQSPAAQDALADLCGRYWPSIYGFLRRRGYSEHDAEDLTQGFFGELLGSGSVGRADPAKGRFRDFLLGALKHYLAETARNQAAQKRGGPNGFSHVSFHDAESLYLAMPDPGLTPDEIYDRRWAATLLERAFQRLEAEAEAADQGDRFPCLSRFIAEEASESHCAELAARLGITPKSVSVAVYRLRARYRQLVRDEVLATLPSPDLLEQELLVLFGPAAS